MEILKYVENKKGGAIAGFFSVKIPEIGMTINDCRLIKRNDGRMFIGFPSYKYEKDGEAKYSPYVFLDKDHSERFRVSALEAIDLFMKAKNHSDFNQSF